MKMFVCYIAIVLTFFIKNCHCAKTQNNFFYGRTIHTSSFDNLGTCWQRSNVLGHPPGKKIVFHERLLPMERDKLVGLQLTGLKKTLFFVHYPPAVKH